MCCQEFFVSLSQIYINMGKKVYAVIKVFVLIAICYGAGYGCGRVLKSMFSKSIEYPQTAREDVVDNYFSKVKCGIITLITENHSDGEFALDLLMISKYFERIGDHATNIAEWVIYSVTGTHKEV